MEFYKIPKTFAQKYDGKRSRKGDMMIKFIELKDGSFAIDTGVLELLKTHFNRSGTVETIISTLEIRPTYTLQRAAFKDLVDRLKNNR